MVNLNTASLYGPEWTNITPCHSAVYKHNVVHSSTVEAVGSILATGTQTKKST